MLLLSCNVFRNTQIVYIMPHHKLENEALVQLHFTNIIIRKINNAQMSQTRLTYSYNSTS